ncbi:hypothetical protein M899_2004 [Bacteriovorax sp. BSW11_IV]|uniref:MauE/DoxX family redox-associated membrane protein n=1 Tax=Bacteriovorax sp. BSW11_IV TaxID=1353529 RepID=UPI00038A0A00|nr:MauE/DoxX family redox-associated membrane protein [Bacteriovorax sp. BSW11_IV]EQC46428.1 hypothetical protein M899_2004 [Bacteriovorax sp. BSW11_IV]
MNDLLDKKNLKVVSVLLRVIVASLFLGAALIKVSGGVSGTIAYYSSLFEKSMLPMFMVKVHASVVMFLEFILAFWLISGIRLKEAWVASGLMLISFAFGMVFIHKFDVASDNYLYAALCCLGLLLSKFDNFGLQQILGDHSHE